MPTVRNSTPDFATLSILKHLLSGTVGTAFRAETGRRLAEGGGEACAEVLEGLYLSILSRNKPLYFFDSDNYCRNIAGIVVNKSKI